MGVKRRLQLLVAGLTLLGTACGPAGGITAGSRTPRAQRLLGAGLAYDAGADAVVAFGGQSRHGRVIGPPGSPGAGPGTAGS